MEDKKAILIQGRRKCHWYDLDADDLSINVACKHFASLRELREYYEKNDLEEKKI